MSEPWIQKFGGIEVCETAYNHPDDPPGQHTNGPMSIWVRVPGGEWVPTHSHKIHDVRFWCEGFGADYIRHLAEGGQ